MKQPDIKRHTLSELQAMRIRGESQTDWAAVMAKTDEDLEADIAGDPDWANISYDWIKDAVLVTPAASAPPEK